MSIDQYGMVDCPTCAGAGTVHESDADRAVAALELQEAVDRLAAGPPPPGLIRRPTGLDPEGGEMVLPCKIDPTEALIVEVGPNVAFSMLLGSQWETECAVPSRDDVRRLVDALNAWLSTPPTMQDGDVDAPLSSTGDPWRCQRCGSDRWVSASLSGPVSHGGRSIRRCVPCGYFSDDHPDTTPTMTVGAEG